MPKSDPPRKRREQSQAVTRRPGSAALDAIASNQQDPNYPQEAFGPKGMLMMEESHSGPLPSPRAVAGYDEVIQNGAERVMVMAEKEQDSRLEDNKSIREFNTRAIKGYNFRGAFSQIAAAVLVLAMLALAYKLSLDGKDELAGILFKSTIVGVVTVFLGGTITKAITGKKDEPPTPAQEQQ